jgi:hypothetical protein
LLVSLTDVLLVIEGILFAAAQVEATEHNSMELLNLKSTFKVEHIFSIALERL